MLKLAVTVVAIALPDCINPSLIGGELFIAGGHHPRRRTATFTLAVFTVTLVFGVALALGLGDLILSFVPKPGPTLKYALITGAGVVLAAGGAVALVRRRSLASGTAADRPDLHGSPALIGAGIAGLELLTAFPYFAAIALIGGSAVSNAAKLSLLALYCLVYTLPLIAIAVLFAVQGERARRILEPVVGWLSAHWPVIIGPLTLAIGFGLVAFGIIQLSQT